MTTPASSPAPQPRFSTTDGDFERLFLSHPWERTPLGPFASWPLSLRSYARMILALPTPAIIFWGPDHLQLYNAGYATIMGPRHPRFLGAPYAECWPDTYPTIHPWMERVLRGEVLEVVNAPFTLTRHGFEEETYFTFTFSPLRDDTGAIAGFLQPVVERTSEVLAARRMATLRRLAPDTHPAPAVSEALKANALDVPFSLVYLWNEPEQRLVLSARSGLAHDPPGVPEALRRAFAGNRAESIEDVAELLGAPHAGVWGDPTRTALALPIRRSAGEATRGALVVGISPRLRLDSAYREFLEAMAREISANLAAGQERIARLDAERERQNLYDFFMQTPAPLCILAGPSHRFVLANPSYVAMVGREVTGKTVRELFGPEVLDTYLPILDRVYQSGETFVGKEMPLRLNDRDLLIDLSYVPLRSGGGGVSGILVFAYDLTAEATARRRSESLAAELQTAVRARDEFLGIASHELKTPLTSLRLQIQMAQRGLSTPDPDKLIKQANRLARLVEDMLDISRINAGKLALERAPADLTALVNDVLDRFHPQLVAVGSPVRRELSPDVVGTWDAYRLEQVITNLITNAMKYAPGKPIHVVTARRDGEAVLVVSDEGRGIAPEDRERVFGRFERGAGSHEVSGLGLGLHISRQIVEAHGGRIRVDGRPAGGAAFVVELPLN
ncbi:MAG TPA: ATP-binding protein [Myxococcales bacterium]|nr:ATP-binding protein [Myxococcales bacterium]